MAREFTQSTFFDHSTYSNVFYAAQIPLEYYLADVLMRTDLTRIQWSSDAYAFRRRFELSDSQNGGDFGAIQPSSLNLPFVNYWYENGVFWEPDDRPFSINSQQILRGQWEEGLPSRLYAIAVKTPMIATAYYSTDQDARLAYELLMWERQPKGPIQLSSSVTWKDTDIQIPVFVTIESVNFNPKFTEVDWLKTQRIFPMQIRMILRTYILYYPYQTPLVDTLPNPRAMPPYAVGARGGVDRDDQIYITEQVLLNFAALKQWGTLVNEPFTVRGTEPEDLSQQTDAIDIVDGEDTVQYSTDSINDTTVDIITGYFSGSGGITINACEIDPDTITTTSCTLSWNVPITDLPNLIDVTILVPGQVPIRITDPNITSQVITGLYANSQYDITVLFHTASGIIQDFHLSVTTANDPNNSVPLSRKKGRLKGMEW